MKFIKVCFWWFLSSQSSRNQDHPRAEREGEGGHVESWKRKGKGWNGIQRRGQEKTQGIRCLPIRGTWRGPLAAWWHVSLGPIQLPSADAGSGASQVYPELLWSCQASVKKWQRDTGMRVRDFPGSQAVKTLCFHCRGHGCHPWSENLRSCTWWG